MIIVDEALLERESRQDPIRVGIAGAGFIGSGIIRQLARHVTGIRVSAVCCRNLDHGLAVCQSAGVSSAQTVSDESPIDPLLAMEYCAVSSSSYMLAQSNLIDVLLDATGSVEFGARLACEAITNHKDLILMNAELDATVGPILYEYARDAGVILSGCDGDQPAVQLNLIRFVRSMGLNPLVSGNIKGMEDRYRTPDTQKDFARKWSQSPTMVTSFADGTKVSIEQAIVANATGMCVARRGMIGMEHPGHVDDLTMRYDINALRNCGGIVDYTIGSKPGPGVFVLADASDNEQARYLDYGKLGPGPLYSFYVPYHLPVFEAPTSIARVAHFRDCAIAAKFGPQVDVISMSKKDLECGDVIDGIGGHCVYGVCENADVCHEQKLLPIGMADGCRMKRSVPRDEAITYDDIELPRCRMVDSLRDAQDRRFFGSSYVPVNNQ